MVCVTNKYKNIIREYCKNNKDIFAAYLFGSIARGTSRDNSDLDLSFMLNPDIKDTRQIYDIKIKIEIDLEEEFDRVVDVTIFSQANLRLKHQIIKGQLIYGKSNKYRIRQEKNTVNNYLDMKYYYNIYEAGLGKEFNDCG